MYTTVGPKRHVWSLSAVALCGLYLMLTGCASVPREQAPFSPGATVETLAAVVAISVKSPGMSTGGRGYMLFQRPDYFHLAMFTPFGTTAMETFIGDGMLTIVIPSRNEAYTGSFAEMPADSPLQGWRMMRLMASNEPFFDPKKRGRVDKRSGAMGEITSYYNASGLLEREVFSGGEEVRFRDYRSVDGMPFPGTVEFTGSNGSRVKVAFDEPELNRPLNKSALTPNLEGIAVLPLAKFKGM